MVLLRFSARFLKWPASGTSKGIYALRTTNTQGGHADWSSVCKQHSNAKRKCALEIDSTPKEWKNVDKEALWGTKHNEKNPEYRQVSWHLVVQTIKEILHRSMPWEGIYSKDGNRHFYSVVTKVSHLLDDMVSLIGSSPPSFGRKLLWTRLPSNTEAGPTLAIVVFRTLPIVLAAFSCDESEEEGTQDDGADCVHGGCGFPGAMSWKDLRVIEGALACLFLWRQGRIGGLMQKKEDGRW